MPYRKLPILQQKTNFKSDEKGTIRAIPNKKRVRLINLHSLNSTHMFYKTNWRDGWLRGGDFALLDLRLHLFDRQPIEWIGADSAW